MGKLKDKVAIITGSGSGFGACSAKMFSREGAKVVVTDFNEETGKKVADEIKAAGGEVIFVKCDVSKEEDVKHLVEETVKTFGRLDIFYNNAGIFDYGGPIEKTDINTWRKLFEVNVLGSVLAAKYSIGQFLAQGGGGALLLTSSSAASMYLGEAHNYAATKAYVNYLGRSLAKTYGKHNIRINVISPGTVQTNIFGGASAAGSEFTIPLERLGTVEEISSTALFLVSNEASFITGAIVAADGGQSLGLRAG